MKKILLLLVLVAAVSCGPKTYTIIQAALLEREEVFEPWWDMPEDDVIL